jgi:nucleotide-binding universal stress UspA family protein
MDDDLPRTSRDSSHRRKGLVFKRLLVPLDGTRRSASVVPLAVQIALGFDCSVKLLNVIDTRGGETGAIVPKGGVGKLVEGEVYQADEYLRTIASRFEDHGISTSVEVRIGDPVKEIMSASDEFGCDIIAMATRSRRNLGRLVFGSVADAVVRDSRVPVLLYRVAP